MTEDPSPENLRKFLESSDPALVRMGISMAKGSGVKVTVEDIQNILVDNVSVGLKFAKEAGIEEEAMVSVIDKLCLTEDSIFSSSQRDRTLETMDAIINSKNEKAIDALIDYGGFDYKERRAVLLAFTDEWGNLAILSQLSNEQKEKIKQLAEFELDGNECLTDSGWEAYLAFVILELVGDFSSLIYFGDAFRGACLNTEDSVNTQVHEKASEVVVKILNEEKDKTKVLNYVELNWKSQDSFSVWEEYMVGGEYEAYDTYLGCISSILERIGNKDKDIDLAIQEILGKIKDSREKHPPPEDFSY